MEQPPPDSQQDQGMINQQQASANVHVLSRPAIVEDLAASLRRAGHQAKAAPLATACAAAPPLAAADISSVDAALRYPQAEQRKPVSPTTSRS